MSRIDKLLVSAFPGELGLGIVQSAEAFDRADPNVDEAKYIEFLERARMHARGIIT